MYLCAQQLRDQTESGGSAEPAVEALALHISPLSSVKRHVRVFRVGRRRRAPSIILSWTSAVLNPREDGAKYTLEFFALDADAALRASTSCGHADRTHRGHVSQLA